MQLPYLVGIAVSGLVGIFVISFFLRYLKRNTLRLFIWYRVMFGIMVIALGIFFRYGG